MTREKVKLDFIKDMTKRKVSYKKRQKGFLSKAHELNTLCDVELAIVVYSPYHEAPKVFPSHEAATNTFTKFKELPTAVQSNSMTTQEKIAKQTIKKIERKLRKVRKENRIMELTNQMYELLNGKDIPTNMHLNDLNNLSYIVNQQIQQVRDLIEVKAHEDASTSHAPQPIAGTSFNMPGAPLLASVGAPVSVDPLVGPSMIPDGTNYERPMAPLLVPDVITPISMPLSTDPLMVLSTAPAQVPQLMFHEMSPLRTSPQVVPFGDLSQVPSSFSSHTFPLIPHQMDLRRALEMAPPIIPSTTVAYPMPSSTTDTPMSSLVFPPIAPEIYPSLNIPSMNASVPTDDNHNDSFGIPRSPSFSQLLSLSDDDIRTLLDDTRTLLDNTSFDINVQDPNHHHHINL